jgi:hypothetical protein
MSYCYDVMSKAWATLEAKLPADVREGELAMRFGFLIEEMHEANHRLRDAINHDERVTKCARALDNVLNPQEGT